jgi:predicted MFS family arabinose efflux permease
MYYSKTHFRKSDGRGGNESFMSFLTDGAFMVWILASFVLVLLGPVEQWFVVDVTVLKGFAAQSGVTLLSLNGIFGFLGRIICTVILKFYPNTRPELHICYAFMFLAVAHVSVVASPVYWGMVLAMVVRGFSSSVIFSFSPSLLLDLRGPEQYPKTFAIEHMVMGIASVIGGYLGGFSVDVTGSYNLIFYIASVGMVLGGVNSIIIFAILKMRKRLKCKYQSL